MTQSRISSRVECKSCHFAQVVNNIERSDETKKIFLFPCSNCGELEFTIHPFDTSELGMKIWSKEIKNWTIVNTWLERA